MTAVFGTDDHLAAEPSRSLRWDLKGCFFFFNDTATTEIYTLSLHDALPISLWRSYCPKAKPCSISVQLPTRSEEHTSELQSQSISYAVFCLKKKKPTRPAPTRCERKLHSTQIRHSRRSQISPSISSVIITHD